MNNEGKAPPATASAQQHTTELAKIHQQLAEAKRRIAELETSQVEHEWVEEALQESTELFRQIAANTQDVFWVINLANNQVIYISPAYEEIWGRTRESLCADPDSRFDTIHPEDQDRVRTAFEKQVKEGKVYNEDYRIVWPDGTIHCVQDRGFQIRNESGKVYRIGGIVTDITERKQAEEERERLLIQIQEQARRVQQIVDTVPEGVLLLSVEGQIILTNPVAEKTLSALAKARVGDTLSDLGNRPLSELLAPPSQGLWHEVSLDNQIFEIIARPISNTTETTLAPDKAHPEPVEGWVMVIRDVTQEREIGRRVQQQERLAAVGQLAAGIAHDFNNILAIIILHAQITERTDELPDRVRDRMTTINQQARHATDMIRQILDFSRKSMLERQPIDLLSLLKEHIKLLERTLPESIKLRLNYRANEQTTSFAANADPTRIQQIITNLVVNARDAMPGGGNLDIGLERITVSPDQPPPLVEMEIAGTAAGEWIQITVSDTGTGIPNKVLPHIFEPFFTTKAPLLGTGLGLAQVHGIVGQHEGYIGVETQVGQGTTFTIYLPALLAPSTVPLPSEQTGLVQGQGETILVVEDNANVRGALVSSLGSLNYRTLEATNGRQALAIWKQHAGEITLILSDVVMPEMGGIALLHALQEQGLSVPVVMLTGHSLQKEMEELRTQGIADWLPKPPNLERLAEAVARALKQGRSV